MTDNNSLWGHIEACMSVVTACLPTIYTLFRSKDPLKQRLANIRAGFYAQIQPKPPKGFRPRRCSNCGHHSKKEAQTGLRKTMEVQRNESDPSWSYMYRKESLNSEVSEC